MSDVGSAYDRSGAAWRRGPERVYARLAAGILEAAAVDLTRARVLDAGAGTGVLGAEARRRGAATVVAVDLAAGMLPRPPWLSAVADMTRLPFGGGAFDLAAAAFSLSHVPDQLRAVRELRRVAGRLLVGGFAPGWTHPAKGAVDAVLRCAGFEQPEWYRRVKEETEPSVADPDRLVTLARAAGCRHTATAVRDVDTGLATAPELAGWRLGMAHAAPFLSTLPDDAGSRLRREAEAAVAGMPPLVVTVQAFTAR